MDSETEERLYRQMGMKALKTESGITALYRAISSGKGQVVAVAGDVERLKDSLMRKVEERTNATEEKSAGNKGINPEELKEKVVKRLKMVLGEIIKLNITKIDSQEPLESYGIDSIMINRLNQKLEEVYKEIPKTLFFEYKSIEAVSEYFVRENPEESRKWVGLKEDTAVNLEMTKSERLDGRKEYLKTIRNVNKEWQPKGEMGAKAHEAIAIIGISGRFPGAGNIEEYWENLSQGKDCITEIPEERWKQEGFFNADKQDAVDKGQSYSKWGGFIDGFADFDPLFFNISPREAYNMDPQERKFLESSWAAFEDAGYTKEKLKESSKGKIGVFAGITKTGFELYGPEMWREGEKGFPSVSFSSVANRVSYLMDINGPSMPIDTMCSSSLTAIHEACEHIRRGECEMALAGGVNLYLHPSNYVALCGQQMLSSEGVCRSFGKGGNGFVPGEGVGVIILKRLSEAQKDKDKIYGVIRGSSINHGGKTNGYTVPSPAAQAEVVREAIERSGVEARAISYIEAHGTGTELGDPIEIIGLTKAFESYTEDKQYCAIGSVKSNLGHLEAAAGIAGVMKILKQMEHGKLAPSLHAEELNPNINFEKTPFKVQRQLEEWKNPEIEINGKKRKYPRIAGISSFGAGGANAHIIIEEYWSEKEVEEKEVSETHPALLVLSARDEKGLRKKALEFKDWIEKGRYTALDLGGIAYTLQTGREGMEERLGFTASSLEEVSEKLGAYLNGEEGNAEIYRGQVKQNKEAFNILTSEEEMREAIEKWIKRKKYGKLLELWVKGLGIDWNRLNDGRKYPVKSLPTYPFAKEKYWIEKREEKQSGAGVRELHPLLHENISDFREQRFRTELKGNEFYLEDHRVNGKKVLAGVAYLEMARAGVEASTGEEWVRLKDVVWGRPVILKDEAVKLQIGLVPGENGEIEYEIYSVNEKGEEVTHSRGKAEITEKHKEYRVEIEKLQGKAWEKEMDAAACYAEFERIGINYGLGHRGIEKLYCGKGESLAQLRMPKKVREGSGKYKLHPSMLDSAFQATLGVTGGKIGDTAAVPYTIEEVEVYGGIDEKMWAFVKEREIGKEKKYDIEIIDEAGVVKVRLKGLLMREMAREGERDGLLMLAPVWEEKVRETRNERYSEELVVLCGMTSGEEEELANRLGGVRVIKTAGESESGLSEKYEKTVEILIEEIRKTIERKPEGNILIQTVVKGGEESRLLGGLTGMLKTAKQENPKLNWQMIEVEKGWVTEKMAEVVEEERQGQPGKNIRYEKGKREEERLEELKSESSKEQELWKEGGVYLITGGVGGIGRKITEEITRRLKQSVVVLSGRSELDGEKTSWLRKVNAGGNRVEYIRADVSERASAEGLVRQIKTEHGKLDGIIHSAGVIKDNYILNKSLKEVREVMSPKVSGLVNIDEASRSEKLEFFILFSSIAGVTGNAGQSDYAAGNAFMDLYSERRREEVKEGKRSGETVSINWPLWKEGGMHMDSETEERLYRQMGMKALKTESGITALYRAISSGKGRVVVVEGDVERLKKELVPAIIVLAPTKDKKIDSSLDDIISNIIKNKASKVFQMNLADISLDQSLWGKFHEKE